MIANFSKIRGIVFGSFTDIKPDAEDGTVLDSINDFLHDTSFPAIIDFNFGHTVSRHVLPLGAEVEINADKAELKILNY